MLRKIELTWWKVNKVWKKKYQGKTYYLTKKGEVKGRTDVAGYKLALERWEAIKAELDQQEQAIDQPPQQTPDNPMGLPAGQPAAVDSSQLVLAANYAALMANRKSGPLTAGPRDTSIDGAISAYVDLRRAEVASGQITNWTYGEARNKLEEFNQFAATIGIKDVNEM